MSNVTYNNTDKLRFWCQKVLPLVYDDSLSYYELLNKIVVYLNSTIEDVQTMIGEVQQVDAKIASKIDVSQKGVANGVATLNGSGKVPLSQLPDVSAGVQTISVNGVNVPADENKNVNIVVMTNAVNDLVNYYLKTETYSKSEVNTLIDNVKNSRFEVVNSLPTSDIQTNVIYLVPKSGGESGNGYDEYINLDGTTSGWELIGTTEIDLSGYVTDSELATALQSYVTSTQLNTVLNDYITSGELSTALLGYATEGYVQTALGSYVPTSSKGQPNGVAGLNSTGSVPSANLPKASASAFGTVKLGNQFYIGAQPTGDLNIFMGNVAEENTMYPVVGQEAYKYVKGAEQLIKDTVGWSGKNLADSNAESNTDSYGLTWSVDSADKNVITVSGTPTGYAPFNVPLNKKLGNGTYILTGAEDVVNATFNTMLFRMGNTIVRTHTFVATEYNKPYEFTITDENDFDNILITLKRISNDVACSGTFKVMIRKADVVDPTYEPYAGLSAYPREEEILAGTHNFNGSIYTPITQQGITWTIDNDGILEADGTATGETQRGGVFTAQFSAQMILSGCDSSDSKVHIFPYDETDSARPYTDSTETTRVPSTDNVYNGNEISFYIIKGHRYSMNCRVKTGGVANHQKFYPLLRFASDPDKTYTPFAMTNKALTDNKLNNKPTELTSSNDLDNITETGFYSATTAPANTPENKTYYTLIVNKRTDGDIKQIIFKDANIYIRSKGGSPATWGSWYKFTGTIVS